MVDKQLFLRLGVAAVVVAAGAAGVILLGGGEEPPPAEAVAVVGEPSPSAPVSSSAPAPQPVTRTVTPQAVPDDWPITYELAGSGTATVVYDENGLGLVHQELAVPLPWRKELTWKHTGAPPTVQLMGQADGPVECRIAVRGTVVTSQESAPGEVATCAGRLG
ncbi:hypothetical protein [Amycolatopsis sp. NPDC059021]|uniref:hypothetical protein n=1 Tax=Amycolatopsis sp. NPDC059021 TaxID=3346704 RepID=UPI0036701B7A